MLAKSVCVIGLGYVGLPTAALLARAGYAVRGVDVNGRVLSMLNGGESPIAEPEVAAIVRDALQSGRLTVAAKPEPADVTIICVPTPVNPDRTADLSMVQAAINAAAPIVPKGGMVILESTSPIGTTANVIAPALAAAGRDPFEDVDVCYCPERVFPGATVREILHNDRVVGGLTRRAGERAREFYRSFCEGSPIVSDATSAEFAKLMENTFRDVNIALANSFARIAEAAGVDVTSVITLANRHPRVNVHTPGPGVGGHCIPVDPWFLIDGYADHAALLRLARETNDDQPRRLVARAELAGFRPGSKAAILGAAYRGNIDDARESPSVQLIERLAERGDAWRTHDPHVRRFDPGSGLDANLTQDLAEAVDGADAVFVMTDHAAYRALSPDNLAGMRGRLIVDGRRMLHDQAFVDAGFTVVPLGAPTIAPSGGAGPRG